MSYKPVVLSCLGNATVSIKASSGKRVVVKNFVMTVVTDATVANRYPYAYKKVQTASGYLYIPVGCIQTAVPASKKNGFSYTQATYCDAACYVGCSSEAPTSWDQSGALGGPSIVLHSGCSLIFAVKGGVVGDIVQIIAECDEFAE